MATITSKYSTNSGYEASGYVECRALLQKGGQGIAAPAVAVDKGGDQFSYNGLSSDLLVIAFTDAKQLRTAGLIDF